MEHEIIGTGHIEWESSPPKSIKWLGCTHFDTTRPNRIKHKVKAYWQLYSFICIRAIRCLFIRKHYKARKIAMRNHKGHQAVIQNANCNIAVPYKDGFMVTKRGGDAK